MAWVDMELDDEQSLDTLMPIPMARPDYPCGLRLSFDQNSIRKLNLEELPSVGDLLDMRCFMQVRHVSDDELTGKCFEAQITMILSPVENENTETPEADEPKPKRRKLFYG